MGETVVQNCTFQGPVWEGESLELLLWTARGLCNLTEIIKSAGGMEALLVVNQCDHDQKEADADN